MSVKKQLTFLYIFINLIFYYNIYIIILLFNIIRISII